MLLTDDQIREVREIIRRHHAAFVANVVGPEALERDVLEDLRRRGLLRPGASAVEEAYLYGQTLAAADDPRIAGMSYEQFRDHLRANPVPLSDIERRALAMTKQRAAQYVVGLGNRVEAGTGQILVEADAAQRAAMRDMITNETEENLARRESVRQLKSDLGWASRDWARDWDRIAATEKQESMQRGAADAIARRHGGDVWVSKRPGPNACPQCKRLFLGEDGHPKIFRLRDLEANGTNVGRKVADLRPVLGTVHPWCACQLQRVPDGWGYNEHGQLVPGGEFGERVADEDDVERALSHRCLDLRKARIVDAGGRVDVAPGVVFVCENPAGSVRSWRAGGREGETTMLVPYGYLDGVLGADGDELDAFLGPATAPAAYVVHQQVPETGIYDEAKVMLGFETADDAVAAYHAHYDRDGFYVWCEEVPLEALGRWGAAQPMLVVKARAGETPIGGVTPGGYRRTARDRYVKLTAGHVKTGDAARRARVLRDGYAGPIPVDATVAQAEDAIRSLPVEHAAVWGPNGGMLFRMTQNDPGQVGVDAAQAQLLYQHPGSTFTHNHPSGSTLSMADLWFAVAMDLGEMRAAVGKGGAWKVRRPAGGWPKIPSVEAAERDPHMNRKRNEVYYALEGAAQAATQRARDRMDRRLLDAGGKPGDTSHPAFSEEVFRGFNSEESFKGFNEVLARWGTKIEREGAAGAAGDDAARVPADRPRADVLPSPARRQPAPAGRQLSLFPETAAAG